MTVAPNAVCACGNVKGSVRGVLVCGHCDRPCARPSNVCAFCRTLTKVTR